MLEAIFLFFVGLVTGIFQSGTPGIEIEPPFNPLEEQVRQETEIFGKLQSVYMGLREYRFDNGQYPETFEELESEYLESSLTLSEGISYTPASDRMDYELCYVALEQREICVDKTTFIAGEVYTPEAFTSQVDSVSPEEYQDTLYTIRNAFGDPQTLWDNAPVIVHFYHTNPQGVEFASLYGHFLIQEGYIYGNEYYAESLEAVEKILAEVEKEHAEELEVLLLRFRYDQVSQKPLAALEKKLLELYPDETYVQLGYGPWYDELQPLAEQVIADKPHPYLVTTAYRRLIHHYRFIKDDAQLEKYLTEFAEYTQHPWNYQDLARYYLYEKQECEPAIVAFEKAQEVGQVGLINLQLRTAYVDCGTELLDQGRTTQALEYAQKAILIPGEPPEEFFDMAEIWETLIYKAKVHRALYDETGNLEEIKTAQELVKRAEEVEGQRLYVLEPLKQDLEQLLPAKVGAGRAAP